MSIPATRANGTIRSLLEGPAFRDAVAKALPTHLTPDRFIRVACTTLMRTPKLAQCDQSSFFNSLLTLSQLGIEPDGRRAHLIPFENRKRNCTEVQLIIDYKGLVELAQRSGTVSNIHADVVCEGDEFEYDRGELKRHRIDFRKTRGNVYAVYALARFKDGTEKCEVMTREDVESIRKRSRAGNSGPWVTDWNEMAKKTVFRRLSKWLTLSPEFRDAVDVDDDDAPQMLSAGPERSLVETVAPFEIPAQPEENGHNQDEAAEAVAGLAPVSPEESKALLAVTLQDQLAKIVTDAGVSFEQWREWAVEQGHIKDRELPGFDVVSDEIARRLVRAKVGMLQQLKAKVTQ